MSPQAPPELPPDGRGVGNQLQATEALQPRPGRKVMTRKQIWLARGVAMAADAIQLALFPLFVGGAPEGADLVLDVVTGAALTWLCGFHVAFLPTLLAEAAPMLDLFPSWTAAVLFVTRRQKS